MLYYYVELSVDLKFSTIKLEGKLQPELWKLTSPPHSLGFHVIFIPLSGEATHPLGRFGAGDPRGQTALSGAHIGLGQYPKPWQVSGILSTHKRASNPHLPACCEVTGGTSETVVGEPCPACSCFLAGPVKVPGREAGQGVPRFVWGLAGSWNCP